MDKGAHFHKCDFQIHTPRDINWSGIRAVTDEERSDYSKKFVKKCRDVGINAVAITDHHCFAFFPYIKEAAENEMYSDGSPVPSEKKLIVFPGLEITLSTPPCQALLIIDADYPVNNLVQILYSLGITPNESSEATTIPTVRISNSFINGFDELYDKLNSIPLLKGKFIVLPNVSEAGTHTLLRHGNAEQYKKMPCVGGYVDGLISQLGIGKQNILNGIDPEYGNKSIAVFQTSDIRDNDLKELGTSCTYVKWAIPTAEALRQACLAKESRLSIEPPQLPQIFITKIDVTNSKFLGSFTFEFNQQYTALIGGRGTGKSTVLEYLRWGLCDQTISYSPEDQTEIEKRRQSLIEKTLVPYDGDVRVTFSVNGIIHIVKRSSKNKETLLKIGDGDFEKVKEEEIRRILPIQAYSQKQLSSVGVRTEELKRFIQLPIATQLNNLKFQISDCATKIRQNYTELIRKKEIQNEIDQFRLEIKSLDNQVENLRKSLVGLSETDQEIISKKQRFDSEEILIQNIDSEYNIVKNKIGELLALLDLYPDPFPDDVSMENRELMDKLDLARKEKFEIIKKVANNLNDLLSSDSLKEYETLKTEWEEIKASFDESYKTAKEKASSHNAVLLEITRIEKRLSELTKSLNSRNSILKEIKDPERYFNENIEEWYRLHKEKVRLINEEAQKFSNLSKGLIKAEIIKSIDINQIKVKLAEAFQGARITESKILKLCDYILTGANPLEKWGEIINELKILAEFKFSNENDDLPDTPILSNCEFNENNLKKMAEILSTESWLNIATLEVEFDPEFRYITNPQLGDNIPFSEASAGQQATALLTVLLNQTGAPLIIDQPEDDIDNRAMKDIIDNIWEAKRKRQLIFTSHNANLVVNGDAELVVCFDYREANNQTRGEIKALGAIDTKDVKNEITSVMEGGEKAFRLRKEKYGF